MSRYGRSEPYKQTLHNRSGCPFLVKGTTRPRPRNDGGTPELPRYQYKQIFRNIFIVDTILQDIAKKQTYFAIQHKSIPETTWAREIPLPNPGAGLRPVRELAEEPRASLNNSYNLFLLFHTTGANIHKQLTIKIPLTLRITLTSETN